MILDGVCKIIGYRLSEDGDTVIQEGEVWAEGVPCRLSHSSTGEGFQTKWISNTEQSVRLFLKPDVKIEAGCKVIVTQNGITQGFEAAGFIRHYSTHIEADLVSVERFA